ncbi:uncharacterized protein LOC108623808 [Ceratina calcarata]|uniref:Uncharacterized protein LOC108623808 n=1 Tax=Ceratina calcarata TaxID=156304 RepID=A0AAJ7IVB2_9HYME|nr:uncharacterized protein LOC108623808 [Ceratina calcarata]
MDRSQYVDYIIPWVQMRAGEEYILRASKDYPVLEPFAPRHSISYFNNYKEDSAKSAHERLHTVDGYDPKRVRCDRVNPSLYWLEIAKENQGHKVPMTTNLWYGRPNRVQFDYIPKKFNRSSKMQQFFTRCGITYIPEDDDEICN